MHRWRLRGKSHPVSVISDGWRSRLEKTCHARRRETRKWPAGFHQLWETIFVAVSSHSEGVAPGDQAAKDLARDFSTEIG